MPLFLLKSQVSSPRFDVAKGFVIRASRPSNARKLAAQRAGDEGPEIWFDPEQSTCTLIREYGPDRVILRAFQNG